MTVNIRGQLNYAGIIEFALRDCNLCFHVLKCKRKSEQHRQEEALFVQKWKDELTDQLVKALLSLKTTEEVYNFLEDVATIGEIRAWAQRLEVARLLCENRTYPQIAQITRASTATISRVRKFLDYGADGYKTALSRIGEQSETD